MARSGNLACRLDASTGAFTSILVQSIVAPDEASPGYAFRSYQYGRVAARLGKSKETVDVCVDSGNPMTMGGRRFLAEQLPDTPIQKLASPVPVRGVGGNVIKSDEFVRAKISFDGILASKDASDTPATGVIEVEIHVIDDFAANLLIGNDVIYPQAMKLDPEKRRLTIGKCENLHVPLDVRSRSTPHARTAIQPIMFLSRCLNGAEKNYWPTELEVAGIV